MRENRTYGSEGGEAGQPAFPTPIGVRALPAAFPHRLLGKARFPLTTTTMTTKMEMKMKTKMEMESDGPELAIALAREYPANSLPARPGLPPPYPTSTPACASARRKSSGVKGFCIQSNAPSSTMRCATSPS